MKVGQSVFARLSSFEGNIGLYFKDLTDDETLEINGNRVFSAASIIKIPLTLKISEMISEGKYKMSDKIVIKENNRVGGTGVIQNLNKDYIPTVAELILLTLSVSDNVATNELVELAGGFEKINEYCAGLGLTSTVMQRKMMDSEAREKGLDNWVSARDIGQLLEKICDSVYNDRPDKEAVMPVFKAMVMQQCRSKIPAKIPSADFYGIMEQYLPPEGEILVANKTGDLCTTQHDAAVCVLPDGKKYILVIFTDGLKYAVEGVELIADLSQLIYNYITAKYNL